MRLTFNPSLDRRGFEWFSFITLFMVHLVGTLGPVGNKHTRIPSAIKNKKKIDVAKYFRMLETRQNSIVNDKPYIAIVFAS